MKLTKKVKLNELSKNELESRVMNEVRGGYNCSCGCNGPSSTSDNKTANIDKDLTSESVSVCDSCFDWLTVTW